MEPSWSGKSSASKCQQKKKSGGKKKKNTLLPLCKNDYWPGSFCVYACTCVCVCVCLRACVHLHTYIIPQNTYKITWISPRRPTKCPVLGTENTETRKHGDTVNRLRWQKVPFYSPRCVRVCVHVCVCVRVHARAYVHAHRHFSLLLWFDSSYLAASQLTWDRSPSEHVSSRCVSDTVPLILKSNSVCLMKFAWFFESILVGSTALRSLIL